VCVRGGVEMGWSSACPTAVRALFVCVCGGGLLERWWRGGKRKGDCRAELVIGMPHRGEGGRQRSGVRFAISDELHTSLLPAPLTTAGKETCGKGLMGRVTCTAPHTQQACWLCCRRCRGPYVW
jgi:hypothetical protein